MNDEEIGRFYAERDARTITYGGQKDALDTTVSLAASATAASRAGQVALLAMANMVARTHRRLIVDVMSAPLRARSMTPAATIEQALAQMVLAINPAILLTINGVRVDDNDHGPCSASEAVGGSCVSVGFGSDASGPCDVWLGWCGGRGQLATSPVSAGDSDADVLGAATAACLGAAAVFHLTHDRSITPMVLNLAERSYDVVGDGDTAEFSNRVGTSTLIDPVDVGDVTLVGAGAVTHGLAWWANEFGYRGSWTVIDGDIAELSNTNRCMGMSAADAGWRDGISGTTTPAAKASVVAALLKAVPLATWYEEWAATDPPRSDVVLLLANERGVRASVAACGEPVLMHATTSADWTAELHRHLPAVDDCPACRIPSTAVPTFACSTGPVDAEDPTSGDAALPFLSATAGLMLLVALTQLDPAESLMAARHNRWRVYFGNAGFQLRPSVHHPPVGGCPHVLSAQVRQRVQAAQPRRHDHLDALDERELG